MKRQCLDLSGAVNWLDLPFEIWATIIPQIPNSSHLKLACADLYNYVCSTSEHMHVQRYVSKTQLRNALMRRPHVVSLYLRTGVNVRALTAIPRCWKKLNMDFYGQIFPTLICKHLHLRYPAYVNVRNCQQVTMHGMWPSYSQLYGQNPNISIGVSWVPSLFRISMTHTIERINILDLRMEYRFAFNGGVSIDIPKVKPRLILPALEKIKLDNVKQFAIFKSIECTCIAPVIKIYACFYYARGRTIDTVWETFLRPAIAKIPPAWPVKLQLQYLGEKIIYKRNLIK